VQLVAASGNYGVIIESMDCDGERRGFTSFSSSSSSSYRTVSYILSSVCPRDVDISRQCLEACLIFHFLQFLQKAIILFSHRVFMLVSWLWPSYDIKCWNYRRILPVMHLKVRFLNFFFSYSGVLSRRLPMVVSTLVSMALKFCTSYLVP